MTLVRRKVRFTGVEGTSVNEDLSKAHMTYFRLTESPGRPPKEENPFGVRR